MSTTDEVLIGVDLGGTNIKVAVIGNERELLAKTSVPTEGEKGPDHVIDRIAEAADTVLTEASVAWDKVAATGIGSPGPLNWRTGVIYTTTNMPGWDDINLASVLQERFNGVPCFLDNDANVACYGEFWNGAGRDVQSMVMLTLGTGVGGGIIIDGQLLRGIDGTAAEIGHMIVQRDGRECGCGAHGCLEAYASAPGLVRTAVEGIDAGAKTALLVRCGRDTSKITGSMISECADSGDAFCESVIQDTGTWLGVGCAGLVNMLNPERIVVGGGMAAAGTRLLDATRAAISELALEVPATRAEVVPGALGNDAGVIGAAGAALSRL